MDALDLGYLRNSAAGWALWKALDHLMLRYFPTWWPESHPGHGEVAREQRLRELTGSASFAAACRELKDESSPLVHALAMVWAVRESPDELQACTARLAETLTPEQGLVLLAVLASAASSPDGG
jgi:hypothetical protein